MSDDFHIWYTRDERDGTVCTRCGIVRRADGRNKPCPGRTPEIATRATDDLTYRREAEALNLWRTEGKAPPGICPHCGSRISVVLRDERFRARCAHRGCGACGPQHYRLTSAVEAFCRPPAYVLRHMGVHPSSLLDRELIAEATERAAAVAWLRGSGHDLAADEIERGAHWEAEP